MAPTQSSRLCGSAGYTLIEILVATTLSLLLLGAVVRMFGTVAESITDSRSMLELAERLRLAAARLQQDLAGVTVRVNPPCKPETNDGYFEYIEGPVGPALVPSQVAKNTDVAGNPDDTTVGDFDDILMFTTRSTGRPFVGKLNTGTIQSDVAEVAWFVRGRTLYRRALLVAPSINLSLVSPSGYYANYDISAREQGGRVVPNTLGDLTRRECRFAHPASNFPYDARAWKWTSASLTIPTLPTSRECSTSGWSLGVGPSGLVPPVTVPVPIPTLDFWTNDANRRLSDHAFTPSNASTIRIADDVILTNVIGFDVKAWDPPQRAYVDLGWNNVDYAPTLANGLSHTGDPRSGLKPVTVNEARVYDTYATTYEGANASNGFDDPDISNGLVNGIVDDETEKVHTPPYPIPLRGIQVKIRVFESDSRQIREVTVVQDFLPQ